jgi:hypothetical protein
MVFSLDATVKKNDIVIIVIPAKNYKKNHLEVVSDLVTKNKKVCYVNITQPFDNLHESFVNKGLECKNFLFIDAVSGTNNKVEHEQCIYVESPNALTSLSVVIKKALQTESFNVLLFDSLSSLLIYNKLELVTRFTHDLLEDIRKEKVQGIFVMKEGTDAKLMQDVSMFADHTIKIE